MCLRLSLRRIFSCDVEHRNVIKIRTNEIFTICATLVPILKINEEAGDVAIRAVTIDNVDWPALFTESLNGLNWEERKDSYSEQGGSRLKVPHLG